MEVWSQNYDPLGNAALSTLVAALPVVVLLGAIAALRIRIHLAALLGLGMALGVAIFAYHLPLKLAVLILICGAAYGLFPIGWIIFESSFFTSNHGRKGILYDSARDHRDTGPDPRIQVILIAFSLGEAVLRGRGGIRDAGGGDRRDPDSVLGFRPLAASGLSMIAKRRAGRLWGLGHAR